MEKPAQNHFCNPLTRENSPDPFARLWKGRYYSVACHGKRGGAVSMSSAARLQDVFAAEKKIVYTSERDDFAFSHWAPELHCLDGNWRIYTCADDGVNHHHRVIVLRGTGPTPLDPFVFECVLDTGDYYSIDASPFRAPNGKLYLMWSSPRDKGVDNPCQLYMGEMETPAAMKSPGERHMVCGPEHPWEGTVNEGSAILARGRALHVAYSANAFDSPDYCLGLLTCMNADDPDHRKWKWIKRPAPLLSQSGGVYGPGHNCFTVSPDGAEDWIVYHAKPSPEIGSHRIACAQRVAWEGDYPVIAPPAPFGTPIPEPSGTEAM